MDAWAWVVLGFVGGCLACAAVEEFTQFVFEEVSYRRARDEFRAATVNPDWVIRDDEMEGKK